MSDRDSRLPPRVEALLSAAGLPERDFDALEARVRAELDQTKIGSTDSALLEAPLPAEPGEEGGELFEPASAAEPRLSDLARAVAKKRGAAADTELARETLSVASQLRSQTDVLIERMRAAPRSAEPPLRPRAEPQTERSPEAPQASSARAASSAAAGPARKTARPIAWLGGAGLALAAAAAFVVLLRDPSPSFEPPTQAGTPAQAERASEQAGISTAPVAEPPVAEPAAAPAAPEVGAVAKDDRALGSRSDESAPAPVSARHAKKGGSGSEAKSGASKPPSYPIELEETPPASAGPRKTATGTPPRAAPAKPAAAAPAKAVSDDELRPAAGNSDGALPDKPSTGAVQAALASVMTAARSCVAGSDAATPATVIFAANGSVKSVVVSGPVQASPAGKCIQSALARAKVAPFAQATFSVGVSVRP